MWNPVVFICQIALPRFPTLHASKSVFNSTTMTSTFPLRKVKAGSTFKTFLQRRFRCPSGWCDERDRERTWKMNPSVCSHSSGHIIPHTSFQKGPYFEFSIHFYNARQGKFSCFLACNVEWRWISFHMKFAITQILVNHSWSSFTYLKGTVTKKTACLILRVSKMLQIKFTATMHSQLTSGKLFCIFSHTMLYESSYDT